MNRTNRRAFLSDVGRGMLAAGLGTSLANDMGFSTAFASEGSDTLYADMSLQTPLPLLERTEEDLARLLFRPGMFTFEKSNGNWTLIHRSRIGQIVRTPVERTADGQYLINRPSWAGVHQVPYDNIDELSKRFEYDY